MNTPALDAIARDVRARDEEVTWYVQAFVPETGRWAALRVAGGTREDAIKKARREYPDSKKFMANEYSGDTKFPEERRQSEADFQKRFGRVPSDEERRRMAEGSILKSRS